MGLTVRHAAAAAGIAAAAALIIAATRTAGPVAQARFSEDISGPLQEHLVSAAELTAAPVYVQHRYPVSVAPAISAVIQRGFAPLHKIPDPVAARLPAEEAW